jgi:hypothetical protein
VRIYRDGGAGTVRLRTRVNMGVEANLTRFGNRSWLFIVLAVTTAVAARGAAPHSLKPLIDAVIRSGPDSQLPAHLSVMIGVSKVEQTTAVKQAVVRDGVIVRTFNVSVANHDDVVIMVHNEQSRSTKAYLSSPTGTLRKAVSYQAGAPATERAAAAARGDFAKEVSFWVEFVKQNAAPPQVPAAH